ncbi:MAG: hypothetical protein AB8F26_02015 [Phycisphaerales bacterium]
MTDSEAQSSRDPIAEKYFGPSAKMGGPFALLGVTHETKSIEELSFALQRRLAQLQRHPMALTPEADEVRLSLHAAMAQLGDPKIHAECVKLWPPGEPHAVPVAWRKHLTIVTPALAVRARQVLGSSGGWNRRAKKRLAMMARANRISAFDLVRAVRPVGAGQASGGRRVPVAPNVWTLAGPTASGGRWLAIHLVLIAMLLLIMVQTTREILTVRVHSPIPAFDEIGDAKSSANPQVEPGVRQEIRHHAALEQEVRNTIRAAPNAPDRSSMRMARAVDTFLQNWTEAPFESRDRFVDLLVQYANIVKEEPWAMLPLLEKLSLARRIEQPILFTASSLLAKNLFDVVDVSDPQIADFLAVFPEISPSLGSSQFDFDASALAELVTLSRIVEKGDAAWWETWAVCVTSCESVERSERENAILNAMERLLRKSESSDWSKEARSLATRIMWRRGSVARTWLLDRFEDPLVLSGQMSELTRVLATDVSVPGVDLTMVLSPDADLDDRTELAAIYKRVWLSERSTPDVFHAAVLDAVQASLETSKSEPSADQILIMLYELVRANTAAEFLYRGEKDVASEILSDADMTSFAPRPNTVPDVLGSDWAVRLINASEESEVRRVLGEVGGRSLGRLAAEAVVEIAFRGPGRVVRERARQVLIARSDDPLVLLAVEGSIGDRPSASIMSFVVGLLSLTGGADMTPAMARSRLLLKASENVLSASSNQGVVGLQIAEMYALRAGQSDQNSLTLSLADLVDRWAILTSPSESSRVDSERIERRLGAMVAIGSSIGQTDASFHLAMTELIANTLMDTGQISRSWGKRTIRRMHDRWAETDSATLQMLASHQAEAEIWELLLEGAP